VVHRGAVPQFGRHCLLAPLRITADEGKLRNQESSVTELCAFNDVNLQAETIEDLVDVLHKRPLATRVVARIVEQIGQTAKQVA